MIKGAARLLNHIIIKAVPKPMKIESANRPKNVV